MSSSTSRTVPQRVHTRCWCACSTLGSTRMLPVPMSRSSHLAHRLEVVDGLVHGLARDGGHLAASRLVERLDRRVGVDAVEQPEDHLALRRDPQASGAERVVSSSTVFTAAILSTLIVNYHSSTLRNISAGGTRFGTQPSNTISPHTEAPDPPPGLPLCLRAQNAVNAAVDGSGVVRVAAARIAAMTERHRALVTAPFRGPGLDTLRSLADVVLDPWIDHQPLRLYNAEQLAARIEAEGADLLIVESDCVKGPVLDLPLVAIGSCRGDPTNVDIAAATEPGIPVLRAPGRNADAVAEMTVALLFAVNRGIVRADRDVRAGQIVPRAARSPTSASGPGSSRAGPSGIVGLGAVGRGDQVALRRPRHARHQLRPVRPRRDPLARRPPRRGRRRVDARAVTPETHGTDRRRAVRPHEAGCDLRQHRPRRAARHRRARRRRCRRPPRRRRPRPLRGRAPRRPTTRSARWPTSCSRRTSAARPTTPRPTTRRSSPTASRRLLAGGTPAELRQPGGPRR